MCDGSGVVKIDLDKVDWRGSREFFDGLTAALKPLTAVFRDSSFANSQAKVNLSEHFRILSPDTKVKVI
jgi:hypothetical protein